MSGKANKARRKQEQLKQKQAHRRSTARDGFTKHVVCPLYRNPPQCELYKEWLDCGSLKMAQHQAKSLRDGPMSGKAEVSDFAERLPYYAEIYGRMIPIEAAYQFDEYICDGHLPIQWEDDGPVMAVSLTDLIERVSGNLFTDSRAAIHTLHALGCLMILDDGTVIPLLPARKDLVDEDRPYDPATYRLARAEANVPKSAGFNRIVAGEHEWPGNPVKGTIWTPREFLALPWVQEQKPIDSSHDSRNDICRRYGEAIPADLAIIDMAAEETDAIVVANANLFYVEPHHLCEFTGLDSVREALHHLNGASLLVPLSNGIILAPELILEKIN